MWKTLLELPLTILHVVSDGLERTLSKLFSSFAGSEYESDDDEKVGKFGRRRFWLLPFHAIYGLFRFAIWAITFPVRAWFLPRPLRACYLRGLPAFGMMILVIAGFVIHRYYFESFLQRYTSRTIALLQNATDDSKRTLYAIRLVAHSSKPRRENIYIYGVTAAQSNRNEVASETMAQIAPDNEVGFGPAHQYRAGELARELDTNPKEEVLEKIQWHLEKAGKTDEERSLAIWARLHQARGEWDKAAKALEQASNFQPGYLVLLADLKEKQQDSIGAKRALERAREELLNRLEEKPEDKFTRLQGVVVLKRLKKVNEAERLLLTGLQLHRDADMQRAVAEFYVLQFDETSEETPFAEKFAWLARAMTIDINFPPIYSRLAVLFHPELSDEEKEELRTTFQQILVSGANPAVAHFALGFLAALTPETQSNAAWHLAQARSLQPPVAIAYNNVAQTLANRSPARLVEAELFARQAVAGAPQEESFYLTLGQVLALQSKWPEAIEVLATATEKFPDSAPLHQSLAQAYEATGDTDKAAMIREIAERIENNSKSSKNAVSP